MVLHIPPYQAEEIYEELTQLEGLNVTRSISGVNPTKESVHVTGIDARKDKALRKIIDLMGLHKESVIGIGDSYNDFSFLTACGLKVAMGNAVEEIKSIADYIAPSYEENGVARVLEKYILENR